MYKCFITFQGAPPTVLNDGEFGARGTRNGKLPATKIAVPIQRCNPRCFFSNIYATAHFLVNMITILICQCQRTSLGSKMRPDNYTFPFACSPMFAPLPPHASPNRAELGLRVCALTFKKRCLIPQGRWQPGRVVVSSLLSRGLWLSSMTT